MDPSSLCSQVVTQSEAGLGNGGLNQGGSGLPFKCLGIDQVRPSLGSQLQKPFVEITNQFQILSLQQRQELQQQEWQQLQQDLQRLEQEQQVQQQRLEQEQQQDAAGLLLAQSQGSSIQASSPKVGVDSQDQEELTMEASTIRSPPINPSPLYSQGVAQSKSGLVNGATDEEVQAPRDLQLSLATTKSGPQEESDSVHKQFASAEELRSIGEQKTALKITLNSILDSLSKGQIECLESCKIAVDVVLRTVGSAVDVKPLEAIFTELFAFSKEWRSIQDPASLYQNEVLDQVAILRRDLNQERELENEERSSRAAKFKQAMLYMEESDKHKEIILSSLDQLEVLDRDSSWIDRYRGQLLLDMDKNREHQENILTEATERLRIFGVRAAIKNSNLKTFVSMVEGILGVGLESADPEVAAQMYAAHKREVMKSQLRYFSEKIIDFFKE